MWVISILIYFSTCECVFMEFTFVSHASQFEYLLFYPFCTSDLSRINPNPNMVCISINRILNNPNHISWSSSLAPWSRCQRSRNCGARIVLSVFVASASFNYHWRLVHFFELLRCYDCARVCEAFTRSSISWNISEDIGKLPLFLSFLSYVPVAPVSNFIN